jgi:hypothetical protein
VTFLFQASGFIGELLDVHGNRDALNNCALRAGFGGLGNTMHPTINTARATEAVYRLNAMPPLANRLPRKSPTASPNRTLRAAATPSGGITTRLTP